MRYTKTSLALLYLMFVGIIQCTAMQQEVSEQKEDTAERTDHRRPLKICMECFDRALYVSVGALLATGATYFHAYFEQQQYGCQKIIYQINPTRDQYFLFGNIGCAVCGAGGTVYSIYELCKIVIDLCKLAHDNPEYAACCLCRRIEHCLMHDESPQQENPAPVDPTQIDNHQPV